MLYVQRGGNIFSVCGIHNGLMQWLAGSEDGTQLSLISRNDTLL